MSIWTGAAIKEDRTLACDVCIVGSGAGGAVVAQRLAEAGKKVIVLEEGGFHTSDTFTMREKDMFPRLYQEGGARGTADRSIGILQGRTVGGTTVVNWTTCYRTPERVLEHWAEHHGAEAIAKSIEPHFARIEQRLHVEQVQLEQINRNNRVLWNGARALGFRVELLKRNVHHCMHTGYCGMGCPIDAKQSMLATFIPDAVKLGAEIYANAWVSNLEYEGRRIVGALARLFDPQSDQPTGVTLRVQAKQFVLAGGGINSPALLLRSGMNKNGRVGKRTFLHPTMAVTGTHKERIEGFKGSPQYVGCSEFFERQAGKMGYLLEAAPVFPVSGAMGFAFGAALQEQMDNMPFNSVTVALLQDGFDLSDPDEGGTVSITESGAPQVDYKWNPKMVEALRHSATSAARIQLAAGAKQVSLTHARKAVVESTEQLGLFDRLPFGPGQVGVFSAHVMGGCAMGKDAKASVVDSANLRHHEYDNLFVIDGSVMPTAATVNPQITIYGLASWASQQVAATA